MVYPLGDSKREYSEFIVNSRYRFWIHYYKAEKSVNSQSIESRNGYQGELIGRKCLCKRSQTDPGIPDFGSRRVYKNEIGLWLYILYYYCSIQYYHFSLSQEKVVRGEKPPGHSQVIRAVLRIRSASKYTIVGRPNSYSLQSYYFREFPIIFANPL